MDPLDDLNSEQIKAVTTTEGAVRVIAGPGTGKTRVLTRRYLYLVSKLGVNPANILCLTFTNKAANEMKARIRAAVGDLDLGYICTIHSFCLNFLKDEINTLGFPKNFVIFDPSTQKDILQKIFEDMRLTMKNLTIKEALDEILEARKLTANSYIGEILLLDNNIIRRSFESCASFREEIFLRYLYEQKKSFGVDFNDFINFTTYILETFEDIRDKWQKRVEYLLIDEFQDVSKRQYSLATLLSGHHGNIFIVGDQDQTIYTWRGSHIKLFNDFTILRPNSKSLTLRKNYRSTPEILNVAEAIIKNNPHRLSGRLEAVRDHGVKPVYFRAKNAKAEADWIISQIRRLLDDGYALNQIGVIYRAHHLTRAIEEKFIKNSVPYRLFSGTEFYNRAEIRDIICYLRMVTIGDDAAFLRTIKVPRRKIGKKTIAILQQSADAKRQSLYQTLKDEMNSKFLSSTYAKSYIYAIETARSDLGRLSLGDLLQKLLDDSGYDAYMRQQGDQDRLDNVAELKRSVIEFGDDEQATLEDFLNNAALFSNIDRDSPHDTVKFLTIHSAKGLEFEVVFLCGLSEGVLPSKRATSIEELQEERRLCYVAMTRAKDLLFLSDSAEIGHDGKFKATSRFIFEAGKNNVDFIVEPDHSPVEQRQEQEKPFSASPFSVNQRVKHTVFGLGIIKEIDYAKGSYLIQFETLETARSLRFSAPLEKV